MSAGIWSALRAEDQPPASHYWDLGVGWYGGDAGVEDTFSGLEDLDIARLDWLFITNPPPDKDTARKMNRYLAINPKLKFLVRIWPILGLGDCKENRHQATFLDYLYKEGVKGKLLQEATRQIHWVLDQTDKPENVLGFTFIEELPYHFSDDAVRSVDENELPWLLKKYQKQIETERGRPLKWDAEARKWWGGKFVQVLNEINQHIKKESGGKWVFVYLQTNHATLDYFPEGVDLRRGNLLPFHYADVIKPGVADGFFAFPNNEFVWKRYLNLATRNNWLFFSQLPHAGAYHLCSWEEALRLAETKVPQNLGYFFYTEGQDRRSIWTDDPNSPADDNFAWVSKRSHLRRFAAQKNIGMELLNRNLTPTLEMYYDVEKVQAGSYTDFNLVIRNVRDISWYPKTDQAVLRNVTLTIEFPSEYKLEPDVSAPATIKIGDLAPGQCTSAIWWPKPDATVPVSKDRPLRVTLAADNGPTVTRTWTEPKVLCPPVQVHEVRRSGERWFFPSFRIGSVDPILALECISDPVTNPSVMLDGPEDTSKVMWMGCLLKGQTLVIGPGRKAVLKDEKSPAGRDVSDRLGGRPVKISGSSLNGVSYEDADVASASSKLKITIDARQPDEAGK
ncbi:MAG: hypothetical protein HY360_20880 [Verrucomicrobia bacterium]|nr:hypothetical protein [Verrucomicrobiota bacterium]